MRPIKTQHTNVIYAKNQPEYEQLPVHKEKSPEGYVTSCWALSDEELEEIKTTKKIYLRQLTFNEPLQPVLLTVENPLNQ